jgi:hypothetical protein
MRGNTKITRALFWVLVSIIYCVAVFVILFALVTVFGTKANAASTPCTYWVETPPITDHQTLRLMATCDGQKSTMPFSVTVERRPWGKLRVNQRGLYKYTRPGQTPYLGCVPFAPCSKSSHGLPESHSHLVRARAREDAWRARASYWRRQARTPDVKNQIIQAAKVSCAFVNDSRWRAGSRALGIAYRGCDISALLAIVPCEGGWRPDVQNRAGNDVYGPWQIDRSSTWQHTPGDRALGADGIYTVAGNAASAAEIMGRRGTQPWQASYPWRNC